MVAAGEDPQVGGDGFLSMDLKDIAMSGPAGVVLALMPIIRMNREGFILLVIFMGGAGERRLRPSAKRKTFKGSWTA